MRRALVFVITLLSLAACSSRQAPNPAAARKAEPLAVRTGAAEARTMDRTIDVTGSLVADETVSLTSEVPGRIVSIRYDFGQSVQKGDVLVELDKQEYLLQLERSKATLSQALARIGLHANQENETPTETPAIRQARAQLEDARAKHDNAQKLAESGDIPRERFVELEKQLQSRRAMLEAAEHELHTQLASIQALKAEKELAQKRLTDTTIRAPFDGGISQRHVSPGQYVKDNIALVTLVKTWPLRLRLDVPEVATAVVRLGDTLRFTTEAIAGREFTATVSQLNPALDARSRSLSAEARLNQSGAQLRPGMFVQVRLTIARQDTVIVVPPSAVQSVAGLTKLFAIRDGRAREVRFAPGATVGGMLEVPGGALRAGDRVAVDGVATLTDGMEVVEKEGK